MTDDDRIRRMEELVRDERARRVHAEQELAAERDRVEIWRRRAEERTEALRRLREGKRKGLRRRNRRAPNRAPSSTVPANPPPTADNPTEVGLPPTAIRQPTLRVGVWGAPPWLEEAADVFSVEECPGDLAWADLVVVGAPGAADVLEEWVGWEARPPLILWHPSSRMLDEWRSLLAASDLVVGGTGDTGAATPVTAIPVARADDPAAVAKREWSEAVAGMPVAEVASAAAVRPVRWTGDGGPGAELEGLVAHGVDPDPMKQAIRSGLALRSGFGPGSALERLADLAGVDLPPWRPEVGLLVVTRRPERVGEVLEQAARFRYPRLRLVVGLHGVGDPDAVREAAARLRLGERTTVDVFPGAWPLGRCLNAAAESTGSGILAKIDDDDRYGPWYLDEAVAAMEDTGADLVGKLTQYVHLVSSDRLVLFQPGKEYREVGYVNGPTFVMRRATWERVRFPHRAARVDSTFVRGLRAVGGSIRTTSRYEFVLGRYSSGHTWETSDDHFLARGEVAGAGSDLSPAWLDG